MDEEEQEALDFQEIEFYGFIRKHLICILLFVFLYLISFSIIRFAKTRSENDEFYAGDEDFFVYRVSIWMCSSALAVAIGAVTLLPFSVFASEVLQIYPSNFYFKWLNGSLIHSMWNYVFFLSNLSLFVLLPFAYFFIESQGFNLHKLQPKPFLSRVYETLIVCGMVIVVLVTTTDVFYSLVLAENSSISFSLFYFTTLSMPLVYSFVSLTGVFLLLLSTPLGFAKMFDIFWDSLTPAVTNPARKSSCLSNHTLFSINPERLQAISCFRKQQFMNSNFTLAQTRLLLKQTSCKLANGNFEENGVETGFIYSSPRLISEVAVNFFRNRKRRFSHYFSACLPLWNSIKMPIVMIILLFFMIVSLSMVLVNMLQLLFGFRALPEYVQNVELRSRHTFGIVGALVENTIILYIMLASLVGLYSMPLLKQVRPQFGRTTLTCIIGNCAIILLLSSALPVLARTLGITSFDLLGAYGRLNWITNFSLVWFYNVIFAICTLICLINKFTLPVRRELIRRIWAVTQNPITLTNRDNLSSKSLKLE